MPTAATPDDATLRQWVRKGLITAEDAGFIAKTERFSEPLPAGRVVVEFDIPILVSPECNIGGTLHGHLRRKAAVKRAFAAALASFVLPGGGLVLPPPAVVTLTRFGSRTLDGDNLGNSFKWVRDSVAEHILRSDDGNPLIEWRCEQAKTRGPGFSRVRIETLTAGKAA